MGGTITSAVFAAPVNEQGISLQDRLAYCLARSAHRLGATWPLERLNAPGGVLRTKTHTKPFVSNKGEISSGPFVPHDRRGDFSLRAGNCSTVKRAIKNSFIWSILFVRGLQNILSSLFAHPNREEGKPGACWGVQLSEVQRKPGDGRRPYHLYAAVPLH